MARGRLAAELPHTSGTARVIQISSARSPFNLATLSTILGLAVITSMVDRRLDLQGTALTASEERFSAVAETAADAIISADHHGNIVYFNPAWRVHFRRTLALLYIGHTAYASHGRTVPRNTHRQGMAR